MSRKKILSYFLGKKISDSTDRLSSKNCCVKPAISLKTGEVTPIYFSHIADKLPTQKMKDEYKLTGRLEYGNGYLILTNFGERRIDDASKLYFAYYEPGKNLKVVQEFNSAPDDINYIFWKTGKVLSHGTRDISDNY